MRFLDEAKIKVSGGHGGPGCVSFRRETFAPRGGPDGGDGGKGGSVIIRSSSQLGTLQDLRYKHEYKAEAGMHGSGSNKAGRDGEDVILRVPVGTLVKDVETGETLIDFETDGQEWIACKGGRGGKGNAHFVSSTFQAPKFAQPGEDGEARELHFELKLFADVGIIGFPNAGKSTLISRISRARPKIADYAFTTLTPNLGVVTLSDHRTFVVADIPGLIEGAHRGAGLGHRFLKHIERTALFIHLLDGTPLLEDATHPGESMEESTERAVNGMLERYKAIRKELGLFNEDLLHKREIVVLNKLDLLESDPKLVEHARERLRSELNHIRGSAPIGDRATGEPFVISAVSGMGINTLLETIDRTLREIRSPSVANQDSSAMQMPDDPRIRRK